MYICVICSWQYSCYDLDTALEQQLGGGQRYLVVAFGLRSAADDGSAHSFVIDEFSIVAKERAVNQVSVCLLLLTKASVHNVTHESVQFLSCCWPSQHSREAEQHNRTQKHALNRMCRSVAFCYTKIAW